MSATGQKKNHLGSEHKPITLPCDVRNIYDAIATNSGFGTGREYIIARGLIEWLLRFDNISPIEEYVYRNIPIKKSIMEIAEEIVILFANILQEAV